MAGLLNDTGSPQFGDLGPGRRRVHFQPEGLAGDSVKMELPFGIQPFNAPRIYEEPVRAAMDDYIGLRFCVASSKLRLLDYMAEEFWPHEVIPNGPDSSHGGPGRLAAW